MFRSSSRASAASAGAQGGYSALCEYLLEKFARDFGRPVPKLSSNALETLQRWKWPGNIRELENWIARIVIFGTDEIIGLDFRRHLVLGVACATKTSPSTPRECGTYETAGAPMNYRTGDFGIDQTISKHVNDQEVTNRGHVAPTEKKRDETGINSGINILRTV